MSPCGGHRRSVPFSAGLAIGLGIVGTIGAAIAIVVPGSAFSAGSVLAIVVFNLAAGWRTLRLGNDASIDLTDRQPIPVD